MQHFKRSSLLAGLLFSPIRFATAVACNNSPDLCQRSYGNITQLGAHDSPFVRNASNQYILSGNQYYNTTEQLSAGVRLVTAQVHRYNSEWHLCHSDCRLYNAGRLSDWLASIGTWLNANPNDVVTVLLVNSDAASAVDLAEQYKTADVVRLAYTPSSKSATLTWPSLQTLIDQNTRLLSFVASLGNNDAAPYLMDEFTYLFENRYDNVKVSDFSCSPDRPASLNGDINAALASNRLPLINHFLYQDLGSGIEIPAVANLTTTNAAGAQAGSLGATASQCSRLYQRVPVYLLVDFFNVADPLAVVDSLNNVVGKTEGRSAVSNEILEYSSRNTVATTGSSRPSSSTPLNGVAYTGVTTTQMSSIGPSSTTFVTTTPTIGLAPAIQRETSLLWPLIVSSFAWLTSLDVCF